MRTWFNRGQRGCMGVKNQRTLLLLLNTCLITCGSVMKMVNTPAMLCQLRPGKLYLRCFSQKPYGSFTISTMPPIKGNTLCGPAAAPSEHRGVRHYGTGWALYGAQNIQNVVYQH